MDTKYYRFLYHNVARGICFSASIGAEKGEDGCQVLYISAGAQTEEKEYSESDVCLPKTARTEHLDFLILADGCALTLERARQILRTSKVEKVFLPKIAQDARVLLENFSAGELCEITDTCQQPVGNMFLRMINVDGGAGCTLVVYLGSLEDPNKMDCVMNVKTSVPHLPCTAAVNAADLSCEMRCLLHQDVMQCKKHNRGDETYFVDGHLLTGAADLSAHLPEVKEYLKEQWRQIRFITLPREGVTGPLSETLLEAGTPEYQKYLIGTARTDASVIKAAAEDPFLRFTAVGDGAGLCVSGCYLAK